MRYTLYYETPGGRRMYLREPGKGYTSLTHKEDFTLFSESLEHLFDVWADRRPISVDEGSVLKIGAKVEGPPKRTVELGDPLNPPGRDCFMLDEGNNFILVGAGSGSAYKVVNAQCVDQVAVEEATVMRRKQALKASLNSSTAVYPVPVVVTEEPGGFHVEEVVLP